MERAMTEPINPADYPLIASDRFWLCDVFAWNAERRAARDYHRAAAALNYDVRRNLTKQYFHLRASFPGMEPDFREREVEAMFGLQLVRITVPMRKALCAMWDASRAAAKSVTDRLADGSIEVIARLKDDPFAEWRRVDPPAFRVRDIWFTGQRAEDRGGRVYTVQLRDMVGAPFDQARVIYGDTTLIAALEALQEIGAPDQFGAHYVRLDGENFDPMKRYAEVAAALDRALQWKLLSGALVAHEPALIGTGAPIAAERWTAMDDRLRMHALIRPPIGDGRVTGSAPLEQQPVPVEKTRLKSGRKKYKHDGPLIDEAAARIAKGEVQKVVFADIGERAEGNGTPESKGRRIEAKYRERTRNQKSDNGRQ